MTAWAYVPFKLPSPSDFTHVEKNTMITLNTNKNIVPCDLHFAVLRLHAVVAHSLHFVLVVRNEDGARSRAILADELTTTTTRDAQTV